jgi:hypothetical protein
MTSAKTVSVNAEELRTTFEFVNFGTPLEHSAYICVDTGKIYCHSLSAGLEEEEDLPEDLETSDRYIAVPHKSDLGLGRRLALAFVTQELSDEYDTVAGFFGRRGGVRTVQGIAASGDPNFAYRGSKSSSSLALSSASSDTSSTNPPPINPSSSSISNCMRVACWNNGMHSKTVRWKRPSSLGAKRTASSLLMGSHERSLGLAANARLAAVQMLALPMPAYIPTGLPRGGLACSFLQIVRRPLLPGRLQFLWLARWSGSGSIRRVLGGSSS